MGAKRQLLVTTAIGLMALPRAADAADLLTKAPTPAATVQYRWTGAYVGAHVGWGWGARSDVGCTFTEDSPCAEGGAPALNPSGFLGGLQAGYNWQVGRWVFGFEADISAMDVSDVAHFATTDPQYANAEVASRYDWLGTARGRAGIAIDRSLFYATGGFAYARISQHYFDTPTGTVATSGIRTGWTVGGGYEYALGRNWSFKAEYLYVNLENSNITLLLNTVPFPVTTTLTFPNDLHIARVGLNYRF